MSFEAQREKIKEICRDLLERGAVDAVIGYTEGGIEGARIPYIFDKPEEAEALCWDDRCVPNLCTYTWDRKDKKLGIVAKPCDARGIVNYLAEKQLIRENIYIIGVDCDGMTDSDGEKLPGCWDCGVKTPPVSDVRIEGAADGGGTDIGNGSVNGKDIGNGAAPDGRSGDFEKFKAEIDKCILCFSCRQACCGCYCRVCFMDRGVPNWQPADPDFSAKMVYHLGRTMHLAGRCVECGACERVCASGVNVRYLIKEVTGFVEELYGFRAGFDPEADPVMASYDFDDREVGFIGGDEHE